MITIKELKEKPIGFQMAGLRFIVKHIKSHKKQEDGSHLQQVVLMDKTGDMLADVCMEKWIPLKNSDKIEYAICEIRANYTRQGDKLLYISQFKLVTMVGDPGEMSADFVSWKAEKEKEIRGKIKTLAMMHRIDPTKSLDDCLDDLVAFTTDARFDKIVDNVMKG